MDADVRRAVLWILELHEQDFSVGRADVFANMRLCRNPHHIAQLKLPIPTGPIRKMKSAAKRAERVQHRIRMSMLVRLRARSIVRYLSGSVSVASAVPERVRLEIAAFGGEIYVEGGGAPVYRLNVSQL